MKISQKWKPKNGIVGVGKIRADIFDNERAHRKIQKKKKVFEETTLARYDMFSSDFMWTPCVFCMNSMCFYVDPMRFYMVWYDFVMLFSIL